jgi:hypothetical protein
MPKTSNSAIAFEPSVAVFDACILYPFHLRNIVVQAAVDRLVEARWTDEIHDEWIRNLAADAPTIPFERLQATRRLMNDALPGATVSAYVDLISQSVSLIPMIAMSSRPPSPPALPLSSPGTCETFPRQR